MSHLVGWSFSQVDYALDNSHRTADISTALLSHDDGAA